MAEEVGFEPTEELPPRRFSRPVLSTAQPPFQFDVRFLSIPYIFA